MTMPVGAAAFTFIFRISAQRYTVVRRKLLPVPALALEWEVAQGQQWKAPVEHEKVIAPTWFYPN